MDQKIDLDLDPKKVASGLKDISEEAKNTSEDFEKAMKVSENALGDLENKTDKSATKIGTIFRNLGKNLKENLKTAFDVSGIMAGVKFGKDLGEGVKQVFELERAFDRLNTRLKLTSAQMLEFKANVGRKIAATGQKTEDILPGMEAVAAKGNVKSPEQLSAIAESLAKAKAVTGEDTTGLAETVVQILQNQGQKVTSESFKKTMDALQGTRVAGNFATTEEAGRSVQDMTHMLTADQQKKMGLGTRELGGLAAMASKGGQGGQDILSKILDIAKGPGGEKQINAIFGAQLFKNGKFDAAAFQNVNKKGMGQFTAQSRAAALGTDVGDLDRFVDNMKTGIDQFRDVTKGANETATQFDTATDNLASSFDKFKADLKQSTSEVGSGLSAAAKDMFHGHFEKVLGDMKSSGKAVMEHGGTIAAGLGIGALVAGVAGGGLNALLKKVPGVGGMMGGMAGGEMAKAAGIQPVYVVNASEIGGGSLGGAAMGGVGGLLKRIGPMVATAAPVTAAIGAGLAAGYGIVKGADALTGGKYSSIVGKPGEMLADYFYGDKEKQTSTPKSPTSEKGGEVSAEQISKAVQDGTVKAHQQTQKNQKVQYTNPSAYPSRGGSM